MKCITRSLSSQFPTFGIPVVFQTRSEIFPDFKIFLPRMVSDTEYAKKHQLKELFEHLMKKVLERKPSDPEILMLNILKRRQDMKQKNPVSCLFKCSG